MFFKYLIIFIVFLTNISPLFSFDPLLFAPHLLQYEMLVGRANQTFMAMKGYGWVNTSSTAEQSGDTFITLTGKSVIIKSSLDFLKYQTLPNKKWAYFLNLAMTYNSDARKNTGKIDILSNNAGYKEYSNRINSTTKKQISLNPEIFLGRRSLLLGVKFDNQFTENYNNGQKTNTKTSNLNFLAGISHKNKLALLSIPIQNNEFRRLYLFMSLKKGYIVYESDFLSKNFKMRFDFLNKAVTYKNFGLYYKFGNETSLSGSIYSYNFYTDLYPQVSLNSVTLSLDVYLNYRSSLSGNNRNALFYLRQVLIQYKRISISLNSLNELFIIYKMGGYRYPPVI